MIIFFHKKIRYVCKNCVLKYMHTCEAKNPLNNPRFYEKDFPLFSRIDFNSFLVSCYNNIRRFGGSANHELSRSSH